MRGGGTREIQTLPEFLGAILLTGPYEAVFTVDELGNGGAVVRMHDHQRCLSEC